jgi:hypothetical protein
VRAWQWLLSAFEKVSVLLKAPQVRLEQAKCSFGIPRIDARSPQTDYAAFLLLHDAPPFGDELLGAAKIVFAWSGLFFIPGHVMVKLSKSATGPKD